MTKRWPENWGPNGVVRGEEVIQVCAGTKLGMLHSGMPSLLTVASTPEMSFRICVCIFVAWWSVTGLCSRNKWLAVWQRGSVAVWSPTTSHDVAITQSTFVAACCCWSCCCCWHKKRRMIRDAGNTSQSTPANPIVRRRGETEVSRTTSNIRPRHIRCPSFHAEQTLRVTTNETTLLLVMHVSHGFRPPAKRQGI